MEITRKDIVNYHLIAPMIERNKKKLERYRNNEPCVQAGRVYGSSPTFPYEPRGFTVAGTEPEDYHKWKQWDEKCRYLEILIKTDIERMTRLKQEIDELIAGIDNLEDKMIFEYIMEGKSQKWIASKLHMEQSCVSKRIKKYLRESGK